MIMYSRCAIASFVFPSSAAVPLIMDEPMNGRAKYGELQMSFVTTSLLLMLHVPPVVLLGLHATGMCGCVPSQIKVSRTGLLAQDTCCRLLLFDFSGNSRMHAGSLD